MKPKRSSHSSRSGEPDDATASDSFFSGALDEDLSGGGTGRSDGSSGGADREGGLSGYDRKDSPDEVADFPGEIVRRTSGASELTDDFDWLFDSFGTKSTGVTAPSAATAPRRAAREENAIKRSASASFPKERKDRSREKRASRRQLKKSCSVLEQRLAETTERLKEVDSRTASKIDSLESELRAAERGTVGGKDPSGAIRTLGKKLIRQAAVIKKMKEAADQYKMRAGAMEEEMAMQDERDSEREEEYAELQGRYDTLNEQKVKIENLLQENLEEMAEMKSQAERDAKRITELIDLQDNSGGMAELKSQAKKDAKKIMKLELKLKQKEAMLDRVTKEGSDKSRKIAELEDELEEKNTQVGNMGEKLKERRLSVENMKKDLENANTEMEELRKMAEAADVEGGVGDGDARRNMVDRRQPAFMSWIQGVGEVTRAAADGAGGGGDDAGPNKLDRRQQPAFIKWIQGVNRASDLECLEEEPQAGDSFIQSFDGSLKTIGIEPQAEDSTAQTPDRTVDEAVKKHEETIKALRSEMVKMSSTYKQDSYLKRKEIAQLKQKNAESALKLRGLEKALKSVNATQNRGGAAGSNPSQPGKMRRRLSRSLHSMDIDFMESKDDMAEAVKARLGGLALYEFPSMDRPKARPNLRDSKIVMDSNFFESTRHLVNKGDEGSEEGRKGELPEEC